MRVQQSQWSVGSGWQRERAAEPMSDAQLVLAFGGAGALRDEDALRALAAAHPRASLVGCSTAGEIRGTSVADDTLVATAVHFDSTRLAGACVRISSTSESHAAGERLARELSPDGLVHVMVFSDGLCVNGSELVAGLTKYLPPGVTVTGGLSADGDRFQETFVLWDGAPVPNTIAAIGFYGARLKVGYGSLGGWDPFGPERLITRSDGNVLHELDGRSALELYRDYLGEHAAGLPATGLLFPLSVRAASGDAPVVRTILGIDSDRRTMTFAGDMPEGAYARLMKANFDRLVGGAADAARTSLATLGGTAPQLAILISCVGRKLVLKQRIEAEVEAVGDVLGAGAALTGFYSYGEIAPFSRSGRCELHNQTMTVTALAEV